MKTTTPLSGKGTTIYYENYGDGLNIEWGKEKFHIKDSLIEDILKNFFIEKNKWYPLGASQSVPITGGLGEFIAPKQTILNPRYASAIAAIMYKENLIEARGQKPILLKRL